MDKRAGAARPIRRRSLAPRVVAALAAVIVVAVLVVAVLIPALGSNELKQGPVARGEPTAVSFPAKVGEPFAFGVPVAYNTGKDTATIDRISLVGASPGLDVVETHLIDERRRLLFFSASYSWPDSNFRPLSPVGGFRLDPTTTEPGRRGAELVFVLRANRTGRYAARGAQVDYRVGDERYRAVLPDAMAACVREEVDVNADCAAPALPAQNNGT